MTDPNRPDPARLVADLVALLGTDRKIPPISEAEPGFGPTEAARVAAGVGGLRLVRGETWSTRLDPIPIEGLRLRIA